MNQLHHYIEAIHSHSILHEYGNFSDAYNPPVLFLNTTVFRTSLIHSNYKGWDSVQINEWTVVIITLPGRNSGPWFNLKIVFQNIGIFKIKKRRSLDGFILVIWIYSTVMRPFSNWKWPRWRIHVFVNPYNMKEIDVEGSIHAINLGSI